jgi:hypothetical protein
LVLVEARRRHCDEIEIGLWVRVQGTWEDRSALEVVWRTWRGREEEAMVVKELQ